MPVVPANRVDSQAGRDLADRIRTECVRQGRDICEVADRAGISRTTLYNLDRGRTGRPRTKTLKRIAEALEIPVEQLLCPPGRGEAAPQRAATATFDRATNPEVSAVIDDRPDLFRGWSEQELDELYSMFGTGGQLTARGVVLAAEAINRKREAIRKLDVVLETHLREDAIHLVDTLYRMVQPGQMPRPGEESDA
ncbi:MAG: XRE family transcriptional regulator [Planctomycetota bacterium]|nr:MAG: XRE family transcriptional regulator [Planctomycetota bacterium]REJ97921.1 MAG: XRE family transcriptional regulator [Planctomycetota bacterium]REK25608.1 MAG: XRE family transcriptional regulator [Planctomycetota bacterium]REK31681.1 MAG: XRE family transcriptional regulator [Planctomycetota bacterium]